MEKEKPKKISKDWICIHLVFCYELENRLKNENN